MVAQVTITNPAIPKEKEITYPILMYNKDSEIIALFISIDKAVVLYNKESQEYLGCSIHPYPDVTKKDWKEFKGTLIIKNEES